MISNANFSRPIQSTELKAKNIGTNPEDVLYHSRYIHVLSDSGRRMYSLQMLRCIIWSTWAQYNWEHRFLFKKFTHNIIVVAKHPPDAFHLFWTFRIYFLTKESLYLKSSEYKSFFLCKWSLREIWILTTSSSMVTLYAKAICLLIRLWNSLICG